MWRRDLLIVKVKLHDFCSKISQHFPFNTRLQVSKSMNYGRSFLLYVHKNFGSLNSDLVEQRPTVGQVIQKGYKMIIFISCWWNVFTAETCAVIYLTQPVRYNELHLSYIIYLYILEPVVGNSNSIITACTKIWQNNKQQQLKCMRPSTWDQIYQTLIQPHSVQTCEILHCYYTWPLNCVIFRWHQVIRISGSWQQMTWWLNCRKTPLNWMTIVKGRSVCTAL